MEDLRQKKFDQYWKELNHRESVELNEQGIMRFRRGPAMRRLIIICEILVVALIVIKLAAAGGVLQNMLPEASSVLDLDHAIANVPQKAQEKARRRGVRRGQLWRRSGSSPRRWPTARSSFDGRESAIREEEKAVRPRKGRSSQRSTRSRGSRTGSRACSTP